MQTRHPTVLLHTAGRFRHYLRSSRPEASKRPTRSQGPLAVSQTQRPRRAGLECDPISCSQGHCRTPPPRLRHRRRRLNGCPSPPPSLPSLPGERFSGAPYRVAFRHPPSTPPRPRSGVWGFAFAPRGPARGAVSRERALIYVDSNCRDMHKTRCYKLGDTPTGMRPFLEVKFKLNNQSVSKLY